jgi:hypothetical protein
MQAKPQRILLIQDSTTGRFNFPGAPVWENAELVEMINQQVGGLAWSNWAPVLWLPTRQTRWRLDELISRGWARIVEAEPGKDATVEFDPQFVEIQLKELEQEKRRKDEELRRKSEEMGKVIDCDAPLKWECPGLSEIWGMYATFWRGDGEFLEASMKFYERYREIVDQFCEDWGPSWPPLHTWRVKRWSDKLEEAVEELYAKRAALERSGELGKIMAMLLTRAWWEEEPRDPEYPPDVLVCFKFREDCELYLEARGYPAVPERVVYLGHRVWMTRMYTGSYWYSSYWRSSL